MFTIKVQFGNEIVDSQELSTVERQLWLEQIYHTDMRHHIRCTCNNNATMHLKYYKKSKRYSLSCNPNHRLLHENWCEFSLELTEHQLQGTHYLALEEIDEKELNLSLKHLRIFIPHGPARNVQVGEVDLHQVKESSSKITLGSLGRELLSRAWASAMLKYQQASNENSQVKFYPSSRVIHIELKKLFIDKNGIKVNLGKKKLLSDILWIGNKKTETFYYYNKEQIRPIVLSPLIKDSIVIEEERVLFNVKGLNKETTYQLSTSLEYWNAAVNKCAVNFEHNEHFYVVGLGLNNGIGTPPLIQRLELIPVTSKGFFVESEEQIKFFNLLENDTRIFIRPNNTIEKLEGFSPTAILLDCDKQCLIEIFDQPETKLHYHQLKNRKMQYYRQLDEYLTYYWHSYRTKNIPQLPNKKVPVFN